MPFSQNDITFTASTPVFWVLRVDMLQNSIYFIIPPRAFHFIKKFIKMKDESFLHYITVKDFKEILQTEFEKFMGSYKEKVENQIKDLETKLVSIDYLCEKLSVSKPTVFNWINKGFITPKKMGKKNYFIMKEVIEAMGRSHTMHKGREMALRWKRDQNSY